LDKRINKEYEVFSSPVLHHTETQNFLNSMIKFSTFSSACYKIIIPYEGGEVVEVDFNGEQKRRKFFPFFLPLSPAAHHTETQIFFKFVHKIFHSRFYFS